MAESTSPFPKASNPAGLAEGGTGASTAAGARTNLELATISQVEAEAGAATTTRAFTAERVAQAIAALAGGGGTSANQNIVLPVGAMRGEWHPTPTSPHMAGSGVLTELTGATGTTSQSNDSDGVYANALTGSVSLDDSGWISDIVTFQTGLLPKFVCKFKLPSTADIRVFIGLTAFPAIAFMNGSDSPVAPDGYIGLQYSSSRDTNWQFTRRDATVQTLNDTSVAVDTNAHYIVIEYTAADTVTMTLYDSTLTSQFTVDVSTLMPVFASFMLPQVGLATLTSAGKNLQNYATLLSFAG